MVKSKILVSTTVIEVGVNIPSAGVMIIEGADRFGLAQLHQLRGRVGRGGQQGHCFLVGSNGSEPTKRLKLMETINDGFKLAEHDLEMRGPGAIYGLRQSGLLDLRVANLTDAKLIKIAKTLASGVAVSFNESQNPELARIVQELRKVTNLN